MRDEPALYTAAGIPDEWVPVLQKMGYVTVASLGGLAPNKLWGDLCGFNKKNKLGLKNPTAEEVSGWVSAAASGSASTSASAE